MVVGHGRQLQELSEISIVGGHGRRSIGPRWPQRRRALSSSRVGVCTGADIRRGAARSARQSITCEEDDAIERDFDNAQLGSEEVCCGGETAGSERRGFLYRDGEFAG